MRRFVACCLVCLCMAGCTPQRRLSRLVARHPELITVDTLRFRKICPMPGKTALMSVPTERFYRDMNEKHGVTVTDAATGITVRVSDHAAGDTLMLSVDVPPDTLTVDEQATVKTVKVTTPRSIGTKVMENMTLLWLAVLVFVLISKRKK